MKGYLRFFSLSVFLLLLGLSLGGCGGDDNIAPPSAPTGVTAVAGTGAAEVSWSPVAGATSYNVYWSTAPGVTKATGTKIAGVTSPYSHLGLTNGTTYYYMVTAANAGGESGGSAEVSATPIAPPTGVTATSGINQIVVSWDNVTGATSYNIYWSTTPGVTKATGTKIAGVTSPYPHLGLTNGTTYYYVVTAANAGGESGESAEVSATPAVPTGVTATPGFDQVVVSWNDVAGATSYNIYWSTTPGVTKATGTKIAGVTSPYAHLGLTNGTTYYYVVTAVNAGEESGESAEVSATPGSLPPTNGISATPGSSSITISWTGVPGALSYNIYWTSDGSTPSKTNGTKIADVTTPYPHTGLDTDNSYTYVVTANYPGGVESSESVPTAGVNALP